MGDLEPSGGNNPWDSTRPIGSASDRLYGRDGTGGTRDATPRGALSLDGLITPSQPRRPTAAIEQPREGRAPRRCAQHLGMDARGPRAVPRHPQGTKRRAACVAPVGAHLLTHSPATRTRTCSCRRDAVARSASWPSPSGRDTCSRGRRGEPVARPTSPSGSRSRPSRSRRSRGARLRRPRSAPPVGSNARGPRACTTVCATSPAEIVSGMAITVARAGLVVHPNRMMRRGRRGRRLART